MAKIAGAHMSAEIHKTGCQCTMTITKVNCIALFPARHNIIQNDPYVGSCQRTGTIVKFLHADSYIKPTHSTCSFGKRETGWLQSEALIQFSSK
jgi:hypothetical protein